METKSKKRKLTLTIREDIIEKAKRQAKVRGVSVSRLFEESLGSIENEETKEQKAIAHFIDFMKEQEPVQALPQSDKELWHKHLDEKHG